MTNGRVDRLNKQLKGIKESFDMWKNSGLNEDVMIIYLKHKTKLSMKKIRQLLTEQQKFFDELIKEEVVKRLTGDKDEV